MRACVDCVLHMPWHAVSTNERTQSWFWACAVYLGEDNLPVVKYDKLYEYFHIIAIFFLQKAQVFGLPGGIRLPEKSASCGVCVSVCLSVRHVRGMCDSRACQHSRRTSHRHWQAISISFAERLRNARLNTLCKRDYNTSAVQDALASYIVQREANGMAVLYWYHTAFIGVARGRYLSSDTQRRHVHSTLAHYFLGSWGGGRKKPFQYSRKQLVYMSLKKNRQPLPRNRCFT